MQIRRRCGALNRIDSRPWFFGEHDCNIFTAGCQQTKFEQLLVNGPRRLQSLRQAADRGLSEHDCSFSTARWHQIVTSENYDV